MNSSPTDSTHSDDFLGLLLFPFAVLSNPFPDYSLCNQMLLVSCKDVGRPSNGNCLWLYLYQRRGMPIVEFPSLVL
ncbi:hypothetical protein GBA52_002526 [Prunus armeniaca]|nr:hypothetical protein GBA52_002526 [Prunus armeniaca]